ncbi:hypothetical protein LT699_10880 [Pseudomonas syringae pv. syringae]|uniref:hypothetical protein n=1 Tax=Pseudomonas syringae TaxID=317 RepID=UPI00200A5754|nr:hypothetical protein [Pseudomonas syringae]MCK9747098.1 hypothetical protein [Pseudomonas syringae pv. syringae]
MHHTTDLHHISSANTPVMFAGQTRPAKLGSPAQGGAAERDAADQKRLLGKGHGQPLFSAL